MGNAKNIDPFVCDEPEVEISLETSRILEQRLKTAHEDYLVSAEEVRLRSTPMNNLKLE